MQVYRDRQKRDLCAANGMHLIEIKAQSSLKKEIAEFSWQCEQLGLSHVVKSRPRAMSKDSDRPSTVLNRHALADALKVLGFTQLLPSSFSVTPRGIQFKGNNGVEGVVTPDYRVITGGQRAGHGQRAASPPTTGPLPWSYTGCTRTSSCVLRSSTGDGTCSTSTGGAQSRRPSCCVQQTQLIMGHPYGNQ